MAKLTSWIVERLTSWIVSEHAPELGYAEHPGNANPSAAATLIFFQYYAKANLTFNVHLLEMHNASKLDLD
jgi:hypothetical protein